MTKRFIAEIRTPTTYPGKLFRHFARVIYAAAFTVIGLPARLFTNDGTLHLFYDLAVSPITFDFAWALTLAEHERIKRRLRRIHVVIVPGWDEGLRDEGPEYEDKVDREARRWRIGNILLPLAQLLPSATAITICASRRQALAIRLATSQAYPLGYWPIQPIAHYPGTLIQAAERGETIVQPLTAPIQAQRYVEQWLATRLDGRKLLTITLRQYGFMERRNSNIAAWVEFASGLNPAEYLVVFVPDTDTALNPPDMELAGFARFPEAALSLPLRMALYQHAWLNMMINNGPFGLCMFGDARYLMFKIITSDVPQTTEMMMQSLGFRLNQTPAFSTPYQRWVWEDDDLPVLQREFNRMRALSDAAEATAERDSEGI